MCVREVMTKPTYKNCQSARLPNSPPTHPHCLHAHFYGFYYLAEHMYCNTCCSLFLPQSQKRTQSLIGHDQPGTAEQNKRDATQCLDVRQQNWPQQTKKKSKSAHQMVHICIRSEKERKGNMNASTMHPRSRR